MNQNIENGFHYVVDSILAGGGTSVWRWTVRSTDSKGRIVASSTSASAEEARTDALGAIGREPRNQA